MIPRVSKRLLLVNVILAAVAVFFVVSLVRDLTRARPLGGPEQAAFREIAHAAWSIAGRHSDLFANINTMLERIRRERGCGNDALDFKTGTGGIVEAEFLVQALQMHYDIRETSMLRAIKQLAGDPMQGDTFRKGQTVTATVTEITSGGIEVKFGEDDAPMTAFIRKSDLSRDRADQRPERFAVGDRIDAQVTNIDKAARRVSLSVKALEMVEEKEAIEKFGSSDSGASLGDILGAALREKAKKE